MCMITIYQSVYNYIIIVVIILTIINLIIIIIIILYTSVVLYASYVRMIKQQVLQGDIENICIRLAPARMWTWLANSKTATEHIVHLKTFSPFQSILVSAPSERKGSMSFSVATVPCKQLLPGTTEYTAMSADIHLLRRGNEAQTEMS